ncbi:hypothetical protein PoB_005589600 [Plakobranchus ocellatus]|uniref:Uncharacterized protein n=1 Tax=Plakobranchus ocellatus TaxID=259542 RepID=A0AAV4C9I8_9GAST|nr:hypothetical protein PoB_005589600 [Plakobranchus ocellatus]
MKLHAFVVFDVQWRAIISDIHLPERAQQQTMNQHYRVTSKRSVEKSPHTGENNQRHLAQLSTKHWNQQRDRSRGPFPTPWRRKVEREMSNSGKA